jgi:hypothetical protein
MRNLLFCLVSLTLSLASLPTYACGGGFGQQVTINPAQTIVVAERDGEETYVFQPKFCGADSEFGLILPVPAVLTSNPTLTDASLYSQLAAVTVPRVETVEVCSQGGLLGGASKGGVEVDGAHGYTSNGGVNVIDQGSVGIFTWTLLKADSVANFTDWLDARQFPYPTSAPSVFDHYVQGGWYFVAFQVTASATAPQAGMRICGDFGPIKLSFPSSQPVIPARMATAGDSTSTFYWRLFTVAAHQMTLSDAGPASGQVVATPRFAGALTASDLAQNPIVGSIATAGEWLTEFDLTFAARNLTEDITLIAPAKDQAYRRVIYVDKEVDCGVFGCNLARGSDGTRWIARLAAGVFGLLMLTRKRRRHRGA